MPSPTADAISFPLRTRPLHETSFGLHWARFKTWARLQQKWWLWPHTPYQHLFVIATWRSGSNLLLSYLTRQSEVSVLSEVLCSRLAIGPHNERLRPAQAIRHIRFCLQGEKTVIRGCKLMLHQLSNCGLSLDDLNREFPAAKYIILYRQALAEQFVSHQVAEATDQYQLRDGETPREAEVRIDPSALRAYCDDMRRRYRDAIQCEWLPGKAVLLSYEDLVADPSYWLKQHICPLLSVPFGGTQTPLVKQNTRPLAERVINYREVAALLQSPLCRQEHRFPSRQTIRRAA